jgi:hypothetical protein
MGARHGHGILGRPPVDHQAGARDDPVAVGAGDAAVDPDGRAEVIRVHDQPAPPGGAHVGPRGGSPASTSIRERSGSASKYASASSRAAREWRP